MHGHPDPWVRALAAAALVLAAACDSISGTTVVGGGNRRPVQEVIVTPDGSTVQSGATLQFQARTVLADGDTTTGSVTWSATGGTITTGGRYTAGTTAGNFRVIARASNGVADSAAVFVAVPSTNPALLAVVVTPATAAVTGGGTVQFAAAGRFSNGTSQAVAVTWTSTGGIVSGTGLYTAGALPGTYQVIATGPGGLADTAAVTIAGAGGT